MLRKILMLAAACGLSLVVLQGATARPANVTCSGVFTGTTYDLTVTAGDGCLLDGAKITHDVIVNQDATLQAERTTIGHDLRATKPQIIVTGSGGYDPGPVKVGHDLVISGSNPDAVYYDICDTIVRHDLRITGTTVSEEIEVGDVGDFCDGANSQPNTIAHDAVIAGNKVGTFVDVGDNSVKHDLRVSSNLAPAPSGYVDVSDNTVGHDAICSYNNPPPSKDGGEDGANGAGHQNGCG
jgi:hypothetical protein